MIFVYYEYTDRRIQRFRDSVDGRNSANNLSLVVYFFIYRVFIHPNGGSLGFLNHQQYLLVGCLHTSVHILRSDVCWHVGPRSRAKGRPFFQHLILIDP